MADQADTKRGRGRPRSSEAGRTSTLTITINPHTRASLEASQAQLGRSLSQTAEIAIERGRLLGDLGTAGPAIAAALQEMLRAAVEVHNTVGDPAFSGQARDALRERWTQIAGASLKDLEQSPARLVAIQSAMSATRHAAANAYGTLMSIDPTGERLARVREQLLGMTVDRVFVGSPDWPETRDSLRAAASVEGGDFAVAVKALLSVAEATADLMATKS